MRGIVQGWRYRKTNIVTLVLVSLLCAGWLRSTFDRDTFVFNRHEDGADRIVSKDGHVTWERVSLFERIGESTHLKRDFSRILDGESERKRVMNWHVPQLGLSGGAYSVEQPIALDIAFCQIHYFAAIIAVPLFAALLLLLGNLQAWASSWRKLNPVRKRRGET